MPKHPEVPKVTMRDAIFARSLATGSAAEPYIPKKFLNWLKRPETDRDRNLQWRYLTKRPADDFAEYWKHYQANKASGSVPKSYESFGLLQIARVRLNELMAEHEHLQPRAAVASKLGSAVMVGTARTAIDRSIFEVANIADRNDYVAMGIGKGTLDAMIGVEYRDENAKLAFSPLETGVYALAAVRYQDISNNPNFVVV